MMFLVCTNVYGQYDGKDAYRFPISPGSKEWNEIQSIPERLSKLQIPDELLKTISTRDLLETCLRFPYLSDFLFSDDYQKGIHSLFKKFNGFNELLKRSDLTDNLIAKYKKTGAEVLELRSFDKIEQGHFTFRLFVLEFLFTHDDVLRHLNAEQEKQIFLLTFDFNKLKSDYADIFGSINSVPVYLLYSKKILDDAGFRFENEKQGKSVKDFVSRPLIVDFHTMTVMDNYLKNKYTKNFGQ
jgi:hypothetical protein